MASQGQRRDSKHRILHTGESIRVNGKYQYKYVVDGKPKFLYSGRLVLTDLQPRTGVKPNTLINYKFVKNLMEKEEFGSKKISEVKTSDAKLFLIKLQQDGEAPAALKRCEAFSDPHSRWQWTMTLSLRIHWHFSLPVRW